MFETAKRASIAALAIAALAITGAVAACGKSDKSDEAAGPAASYTVRGEVDTIVTKDGATTAYIHHEAIPTFADRAGDKVGMVSMTMPFGVAPEVSLDGIAAGDKVEFSFDVVWTRRPSTRITAVKKLPADTPLELRGM